MSVAWLKPRFDHGGSHGKMADPMGPKQLQLNHVTWITPGSLGGFLQRSWRQPMQSLAPKVARLQAGDSTIYGMVGRFHATGKITGKGGCGLSYGILN